MGELIFPQGTVQVLEFIFALSSFSLLFGRLGQINLFEFSLLLPAVRSHHIKQIAVGVDVSLPLLRNDDLSIGFKACPIVDVLAKVGHIFALGRLNELLGGKSDFVFEAAVDLFAFDVFSFDDLSQLILLVESSLRVCCDVAARFAS